MFPTDLRNRLILKLFAAVLISGILVQTAFAITIRVPGDFPRIQQAIDAARPSDEIVVNAGVYRETLIFRGKMRIILRSFDPDANPKQVTIRAFSDGTGVEIVNSSAAISGNGVSVLSSLMSFQGSQVQNNSGVGIEADEDSLVSCISTAVNGNGTDFSGNITSCVSSG